MLKRIATRLFRTFEAGDLKMLAQRPKARLGCERFEDRINPSGWLDDYASYFPDIGLGEHVLYPVVNLVFSDDTLANASDTQLLAGTAGVVVVAVVGAEVATVAVTGTSIGGVITGGGAAEAASLVIQFGANPNQVYHTFRHVVAAGMNPGTVQTAVQADLAANAAAINAGLNIRTIVVAGQQITYNAFRLPSGVVNVGRITVL